MTKRLAVLLAVVALVAGVAPLDAGAQTTSQREKRLREQWAEASKEEAALLDQLDEVEAERRALDGKVAALDQQVAAAQQELDAATALFDERSAALARAQLDLTLARRRLAEARAKLTDRAVRAYMGEPDARGVARFARLDTQRELAAAHGYLRTLVENQHDEVDRYQARRRELEAVEAAVQLKRDEAKSQRDVVAQRTGVVEAARREQAGARNGVLAQEHRQEALVRSVRGRKAEFEAQIAALRAESSTITAFLRARQAGQGPPISGRIFASPIPGAAITSTFGPRVHPIFGDVRVHTGIDFRAATGTPVRAAGTGVVLWAGPRGGYGNAVIIDHGNSMATLYGHLSSVAVRPGSRVSKGQIIGRAGSTGFSTGPHLHFEVRARGVPVNPMGYL